MVRKKRGKKVAEVQNGKVWFHNIQDQWSEKSQKNIDNDHGSTVRIEFVKRSMTTERSKIL